MINIFVIIFIVSLMGLFIFHKIFKNDIIFNEKEVSMSFVKFYTYYALTFFMGLGFGGAIWLL